MERILAVFYGKTIENRLDAKYTHRTRIAEIFRGLKLSRISRFRGQFAEVLTAKISIEYGCVIINWRVTVASHESFHPRKIPAIGYLISYWPSVEA